MFPVSDFFCCEYHTHAYVETLDPVTEVVVISKTEKRRLGIRVTSETAPILAKELGGESWAKWDHAYFIARNGQRYPNGGWLVFDDDFEAGYGLYLPISINPLGSLCSLKPIAIVPVTSGTSSNSLEIIS